MRISTLLGATVLVFGVVAAVLPVDVEYGSFIDYESYGCGSVLFAGDPDVPNYPDDAALEPGTPRRPRVEADCDSKRSTLLYVAAGLLVGGGAVLFFARRRSSHASSSREMELSE